MSNIEEKGAVGGLSEDEREWQAGMGVHSVGGARERVPSAKGKEYKISQVKEKVGFFQRKWKHFVNRIGKGMKEASSLMHLIKMSDEEMELYSNYVSACMELRDLKQEESDELDELENLKVDEQIHQETVKDLKSKNLYFLMLVKVLVDILKHLRLPLHHY